MNEMADDRSGTALASPPAMTRVAVVDDHAVVRRGLRQVLEPEPTIHVVAEAANLTDARSYVRGHDPNVLVLDLNLADGLSLHSIPALCAEFPDTQIVVLTMQDERVYARTAVSAGALGYVLKEAAELELVEAVRRAARGHSYLSPKLGRGWRRHHPRVRAMVSRNGSWMSCR